VLGTGTRVGGFSVAAILKQPVSPQFRTAWLFGERGSDILPPDAAVLLHAAVSDAVRNALVAECVDQPVENCRGVVPLDCSDDAVPGETVPGILDQASRTSNWANPAN
jgi:hypothetical protein